jgi:circadian clock protein KaiC
MLRFAQTLSYFDASLIDQSVIYADVSEALTSGNPESVLKDMTRLVERHRPALVVIDSFKAIQDMFSDSFLFRIFTTTTAVRLTVWETTALLVGEYNESEIRQRPEFAIADGIIYLHGTEEGLRQNRLMRIMKMRGTSFFGGDHGFEIDGDGITLYPRMSPTVVGEYAVPTRRLSSAVTGLNEMMDGGLHEATACLITGSSGTGKTLMALGFAVAEAQRGRVLYVTLEESPDQLIRNSETFGWDVGGLVQSGNLEILHISPSELNIDRHAAAIRDRALSSRASLVVLDSISSIEAAVPDVAKYQSYLWAVNDHFKRAGVTTVMTSESVPEGRTLTARHISLFADTIIALEHGDNGGQSKRTVRLVKMRGSSHALTACDLLLDAPEILIRSPQRDGAPGVK